MQEINQAAHPERLKITEIFLSLQGETRSSGWPTVFVRLTGCPLRCTWCDSAYAFTGGEWMSHQDVMDQVKQHPVNTLPSPAVSHWRKQVVYSYSPNWLMPVMKSRWKPVARLISVRSIREC